MNDCQVNCQVNGFRRSAQLGAQLKAVRSGQAGAIPWAVAVLAGIFLYRRQSFDICNKRPGPACLPGHAPHEGTSWRCNPATAIEDGQNVLLHGPLPEDLYNVHGHLFQQQGQVSLLTFPHEALINVVC